MVERLTWKEIKEKYPEQWVGLVDVEWKDEINIISAVVKYTNVSREELMMKQCNGETICRCTMSDFELPLGALTYWATIPKEFGEEFLLCGQTLTWDEIKEKYPEQWVGLVDVELDDTGNVKTAIVMYDGLSKDELLVKQQKVKLDYLQIYNTGEHISDNIVDI